MVLVTEKKNSPISPVSSIIEWEIKWKKEGKERQSWTSMDLANTTQVVDIL